MLSDTVKVADLSGRPKAVLLYRGTPRLTTTSDIANPSPSLLHVQRKISRRIHPEVRRDGTRLEWSGRYPRGDL